MKLTLVPSDESVLRAKAARVANPPSVTKLASDLHETMLAEGGVGLAAPQVGKGVRVFVSGAERPLTFINPEITWSSGEQIWWEEGCLSLPRLLGQVKRPKEVKVRALDPSGGTFRLQADGLLARVIQHEIDHLDGIMFTDRMEDLSSLKRITEAEWESRHQANRAKQTDQAPEGTASELV